MAQNKKVHFIGIGGSGMSALAQITAQKHPTTGSDRFYKPDSPLEIFNKLRQNGITLFPQNGSGIDEKTALVVYSTAIEKSNPDWVRAQSLKIPTLHRASYLAESVSGSRLIAVGGTSGKTTITGMTGVLLDQLGASPNVISGGEIKNFISKKSLGNVKAGTSDLFVIETDESDGTIKEFYPSISILANISKDHKTLEELNRLFLRFVEQTQECLILNRDCPNIRALDLNFKKTISFGIDQPADFQATDIRLGLDKTTFNVQGTEFILRVPGIHNVSNALAAICAGAALGYSLPSVSKGLEAFKGVKRRLDLISNGSSFRVIDDFAHNPDKIRASLHTVAAFSKRLLVVFQPHGYMPTRFLFEEYLQTFKEGLKKEDRLFLLPIFDAGGTTDRSVSSEDLADHLRRDDVEAAVVLSRKLLLECLGKEIKENDTVLVMGARDPSLTPLCHQIAGLKI